MVSKRSKMRKYLNKTELIAGDFGQGFVSTVFSHFSTKTNKAHLKASPN